MCFLLFFDIVMQIYVLSLCSKRLKFFFSTNIRRHFDVDKVNPSNTNKLKLLRLGNRRDNFFFFFFFLIHSLKRGSQLNLMFGTYRAFIINYEYDYAPLYVENYRSVKDETDTREITGNEVVKYTFYDRFCLNKVTRNSKR